jgi:hypothetical protein
MKSCVMGRLRCTVTFEIEEAQVGLAAILPVWVPCNPGAGFRRENVLGLLQRVGVDLIVRAAIMESNDRDAGAVAISAVGSDVVFKKSFG